MRGSTAGLMGRGGVAGVDTSGAGGGGADTDDELSGITGIVKAAAGTAAAAVAGVDYASGNAGWELVETRVLVAPATEITFSGLDGDTYDYSIGEGGVILAASSFNGTVKCNGSNTGIAYLYQNINGAGATSGVSELFGAGGAEPIQMRQFLVLGISAAITGANRTWGFCEFMRDSGGTIGARQPGAFQRDNHTDALTSFSLVSSAVGGFAAGTTLPWRRRRRA